MRRGALQIELISGSPAGPPHMDFLPGGFHWTSVAAFLPRHKASPGAGGTGSSSLLSAGRPVRTSQAGAQTPEGNKEFTIFRAADRFHQTSSDGGERPHAIKHMLTACGRLGPHESREFALPDQSATFAGLAPQNSASAQI
jgi:hypothetical protein